MSTWRARRGTGHGVLVAWGLRQHKADRSNFLRCHTQQKVNQQEQSPAVKTGASDWVSQASDAKRINTGDPETTQLVLRGEKVGTTGPRFTPVYQGESGHTSCRKNYEREGKESDRKTEAGQHRGPGGPAAQTPPATRTGPSAHLMPAGEHWLEGEIA